LKSFSIRHLTLQTFTVGIGRWFSQVLNVLLLPIALVYISPEEFGVFSLLQIIALIGGVFMSLGLSNAFIAQFGAEGRDNDNLLGRVLTQQLLFGGILFCGLFFSSRPILNWLNMDSPTSFLFLLLLGEYFANLVLIINRWQILVGRHLQVSIIAFVRTIIQLVLIFVFVIWRRDGLLGLVIADMGAKLAGAFLAHVLNRKVWQPEFKKSDVQNVFRLGLPAMPDPIFFWLIIFLPLYLLQQNGLLALAGAFSLAWRLMSPVELLGNSLASAVAAKMLDKETPYEDLNRWHRLSVGVIAFSTLGIVFFSPDIFRLFLSEAYYQIVPMLPLIAAGVMFLAYYYFEWISVSASGKTYGLSLASGSGVSVMMLGALVGTSLAGFEVSWLFALSFFVMWGVARLINGHQRLGRWFYLVGCVLLTSTVNTFAVKLVPSLPLTISKSVFLILVAISIVVPEIFAYFKKTTKGLPERKFITIPTYAEIAKSIDRSESVLDVGCSEGFFLGDLETTGLRVGIDNDFERLRIGKKTRPDVNFVYADASKLPFRQDSFQAIVLIGVLPYIKNPEIILSEARRVLKPYGHVEVSAANTNRLHRFLNIYNWRYHFRFYDLTELESILKEAGFDVRSLYTRGRWIAPLLGNLFVVLNLIDRRWSGSTSVIGPSALWARRLINPIIQWEYDHHRGEGYQIFASGFRNE
jgi:O-antigen/teichoic acid export membrane protein